MSENTEQCNGYVDIDEPEIPDSKNRLRKARPKIERIRYRRVILVR